MASHSGRYHGPERSSAGAIRQAFSQPDREQAGATWRYVAD